MSSDKVLRDDSDGRPRATRSGKNGRCHLEHLLNARELARHFGTQELTEIGVTQIESR